MSLTRRTCWLLFTLLLTPMLASAQSKEEARLIQATSVVEELNAMPDQRAPDWLLARAYGIAVIPNVVKVGLGIGGRGGKGAMVVRNAQGGWSNPVFITLGGGSFGWQAGVQSADLLLVLTSERSVEGITAGKVTLGADASVAAGPVGRQTSAATDVNLSEIYSYSRASGLFAGIAIDGSVMAIDKKANAIFYSIPDVKTADILASTTPPPPAARRFIEALDKGARAAAAAETPKQPAATQPAATQPASTEPASPAVPPATQSKDTPPAASDTKTYPMEDQNPGKEPPN
jgi:lipid-binding SYLF domain-containing protein